MEVEELGSDGEILAAIQAKGTQASLVVPDGMNEAKRDELSALAGAGVNVRVLPKSPLYLHAKLIVGQTSAYVGSQNFSETCLA
jgi:phosphatidylserine/phosphatidylglycerophosphate/cardiolipin synthase-like enzyme